MSEDSNPYQSPPTVDEQSPKTGRLTHASITNSDKIGIATVTLIGSLFTGLYWVINGRIAFLFALSIGTLVLLAPAVVFAVVSAWTYLGVTRGSYSCVVRWIHAVLLAIFIPLIPYTVLVATWVLILVQTGSEFDIVDGVESFNLEHPLLAGGLMFVLVTIFAAMLYLFIRIVFPSEQSEYPFSESAITESIEHTS